MEKANVLEKVAAFITCRHKKKTQLLLFRHTSGDIQIPAGTVEPHEQIDDAVLREIHEETGLQEFRLVKYLGSLDIMLDDDTFAIARQTKVFAQPNDWSFDWACFRRGIYVRKIREQGEFSQVCYEEYDQFYEKNYVTYNILGWVPSSSLAQTLRRHFYHFVSCEPYKSKWTQLTDNHYFQLFWADLDDLPEMQESMSVWIRYCTHDLRYEFAVHTENC